MFGTENKSSHPYLSYTDGIASSGLGDFLLLVARVMGGVYFTMSGWGKVTGLSDFVAGMTARGVPLPLAYLAPFVEFLGGLALMVGFATRYAALALFVFTIAATWISHRYWLFPPEQQRAQYSSFWKNITIMGGQLALFVAGPGRLSVDRWLTRRR
jgi:putative oxidoreductase